MVVSNRDRIGKLLEGLREGLTPFVTREMRGRFGQEWQTRLAGQSATPDAAALFKGMLDYWPELFSQKLGNFERSLVHELRDARNRWAHQEAFTLEDTERALDNGARLLRAVSAPQADVIERERQELLRVRFEELAKREERRAAATPATDGQTAGGLKPWRDVVMPHPDVATGRYQQAEFAADLGQVQRGEGGAEYRTPRDFFARTFLTGGLQDVLANALRRLGGTGGDPVVKLQTNFGGGKTHAMIALYHLCSGAPASDFPGLEAVFQAAQVAQPPKANRAVLVGTALSPGQTHRKPDGTVIHTLWGEMAHQLLGADGYALVAEADRTGTSPGSDVLRELFAYAAPCLILIDEWVAYVRQLYGTFGYPAGSFDANLTFAQALTEAAAAVPQSLVVASIPASDIEVGGTAGREALRRMENTFGRVEAIWRPASAEEGFEIVRRRLFQPITDPALFTARDAVARAFGNLYRSQAKEFPPGCGEGEYERRIVAAYPIHPELFDRLYEDWSALERFQRTRGVLRLMAKVIHALWARQDKSLLILPGNVPMDDPEVQSELTTRYLEEQWMPVVESDVDGRNALPGRIDVDNPNFGRYAACRRVARTVFLGSAPKLKAATKGVEERSIRLGCVQPSESVATFGDALRRLTNQATYLYVDNSRYWYSVLPSVARMAQDRAAQWSDDEVFDEIRKRVRDEARQRGDFVRVYPCPASASDVPDEAETRLVILDPEAPHSAADGAESRAMQAAQAMLDSRGTSPRRCRNMLVFLAADRARLDELCEAVRAYRAWHSIHEQRESLNLDTFQQGQARSKVEQFDETVKQRIGETFQWLIVPAQPDAHGPIVWEKPIRVQGSDPLAVRASRKLKAEGMLITEWAPSLLRRELDAIPLWDGDHIAVKALWEHYAQYLYLSRLKDSNTLCEAIRMGASAARWGETFAYAERWDEAKRRYEGLNASASVRVDGAGVVVKPEIARAQIDADYAKQGAAPPLDRIGLGDEGGASGQTVLGSAGTTAPPPVTASAPETRTVRRYYGAAILSTLQPGRDASTIATEIVRHLAGLVDADVKLTLHIEAKVPNGIPDQVIRTISENSRTLKFQTSEFEEA